MIGYWTTSQLADALGVAPFGPDTAFSAVTTDSRQPCPQSLFVALKGKRFDAHEFVGQAIDQGAVAVMIEHPLEIVADSVAQIVVEDTLIALGRLGAFNRDRFNQCVVAITGSAGKTTVKELVAAIFAGRGLVCKTQGNLNNHIGVPLSLLALQAEHQGAVFELGASGLNEISYTVGLVKPDIAVLNNAHEAHVEGFGSLENVMRAKGEIVRDMPSHGVAVLNADDVWFQQWQSMVAAKQTLTFGLSASAQVTAVELRLLPDRSEFILQTPTTAEPVNLPLPGQHNVMNALAAGAAGVAAGFSIAQIKTGLETVPITKGRLAQKQGVSGSVVIDDTYNASPAAVKAALKVLAKYPGRKIAVLGHMAELGELSVSSHLEVGRFAQEMGIHELWVTGEWAEHYRQGFGTQARVFASKAELAAVLVKQATADDVILVKGSRSAGMEYVVTELCREREAS